MMNIFRDEEKVMSDTANTTIESIQFEKVTGAH